MITNEGLSVENFFFEGGEETFWPTFFSLLLIVFWNFR